MITAKDIREVMFTRAMGGYKTVEVDNFLDQCANTVEELTRVNEENARKLQVLADTVVDYRNQEDSIRSALISAQRMSESVISDARKQAEEIIQAAREEAMNMQKQALEDTAAEQNELIRVKQEVAAFKSRLMSTYREHLTLIGVLEGEENVPVSAEPPVTMEEPTVSAEEEQPSVGEVAEDYPSEPLDLSAFQLNDDE